MAIVTLLVVTVVFLFAQHNESLPAGSQYDIISKVNFGSYRDASSSKPQVATSAFPSSPVTTHVPALVASPIASQDENPTPESSVLDPHNVQSFPSPSAPDDSTAPSQVPDPLMTLQDKEPPPTFEAEYQFQQDLDLDLPIEKLQSLSTHNPHNYNPTSPQTYAYATFMATRNPSLKDPYFLAIHSLIYRVLWSQRTRTTSYPFIVFVADFVTPAQRTLLSGAGAIVRELAPLDWEPNIPGVQKRWKDLFAKLNMWNETDFSRILFLDADAFPLENIDAMFDVAPVRSCDAAKLTLDDLLPDETPVCEDYIFAGVPQDPLAPEGEINVGSMVFTPSARMHARLLQNYVKTERYDCLMAEQAFLGWQFSHEGPFPASALGREWGGFFPQEDEEGKLKVVHEKIWVAGEGWMRREWEGTWVEMLGFYESAEFEVSRQLDGLGLSLR